DIRDHEAIADAVRPETRFVLAETIGNPGLTIADIPVLADIAHTAGVPLVIDNTFASPYLCRPAEWGADIEFHSATKYISGHGSVIAGGVVDAGTVDWAGSGRFPRICERVDPYGGIVFADPFGPAAFAALARAEGVRDFGAALAAVVAYRLVEGVESLAVRMQRHSANARLVGDYLASAPG